MFPIPTVQIKDGDSYAVINECDFNPEIHVRFGEDVSPTPIIHQLSRGENKGKFVIKLGDKVTAGPFDTEELAQAALVTPDGDQTPIPEEWEAMTDDELIHLAEKLSGEPVNGGSDGTAADKARSIIMATVSDRESRK